MKYHKLGKTDINVSQVSFGTWGIGGGPVWSDMRLDKERVANLLDVATENGINYIDTAPVYGNGESEMLLGEALRDGRRDKFVLQTKCSLNWREEGGIYKYSRAGHTVNNDTSAKAIRRDVEDSLKRLKTDYIDVIVVHYVNDNWDVAETMGELNKMMDEGLIRAAGLSNSHPVDLIEYEKHGNIALVQEQYSLVAAHHGNEYFDEIKKRGTTFQVYGALEEGFLTSPDYVNNTFGADDIRSRLPWTTEALKKALADLFETMKPMTRKYQCSYSNLVQAWTLKNVPNVNLLTGFRREETICDTCKVYDIELSDEDAQLITAAAVPAQVKDLDK